MSSRLIRNARIFVDGKIELGDSGLSNGQRVPASQVDDAAVIDASGRLLIPGLIDLSLRAADLATESKAAYASGITQFCLQPDSTSPLIDKAAVARATRQAAAEKAPGRVLLLGAASQSLAGEQLAEMAALKQAGCIALSDAGKPWRDLRTLKRAMEYAHSTGIALHLTAQEQSLADGGCAHAGAVASELGLPGLPSSAESGTLAMMLELIEETGARVHFNRLSCARSVELIAQAKQRQLPVTADVAIHNLLLTEEAVRGYNSLCHVRPPLRAEIDRQALLKGVNDGVLDAITSDHQPCSEDDKLAPFPATKPGIAAAEHLLYLCLQLVQENALALEAVLHALCYGPAAVLGIPCREHFLLDTDSTFRVDKEQMLSQGKNTPYHGWQLSGALEALQ